MSRGDSEHLSERGTTGIGFRSVNKRAEYFVQQLEWEKRGQSWYPAGWTWQVYDRENEWSDRHRRILICPALSTEAVDAGAGGSIPQEVVLEVVRVVATMKRVSHSPHELLHAFRYN